uniref:Cytochrome c-type biogenesis protein n=2 Tax=Oryza TaxID=4527 RepID=A0A0E0NCZ8_ORYRU
MATEEDVKQRQIIESRARNISHNVRCTECGSQSIEDSQADIAILLRKLIRDEIKSGKSDKEIYKKLQADYGETILYTPKFDLQTAAIWLSPVIVGGVAAGVWAYQKHRQRTNVHIMALNLVRGVPLTPREKETMLDVLTPPPPANKCFTLPLALAASIDELDAPADVLAAPHYDGEWKHGSGVATRAHGGSGTAVAASFSHHGRRGMIHGRNPASPCAT